MQTSCSIVLMHENEVFLVFNRCIDIEVYSSSEQNYICDISLMKFSADL